MKRYLKIILSCLFMYILPDAYTQTIVYSSDKCIQTNLIKESIILTTDRTLYSVGEDILFNAEYITDKYIGDIEWSEILYVELINVNGNIYAQGKYQLSKDGASGNISIPNNIYSGIYFVRAYTKWMKNYKNASYAYHEVKIINPLFSKIEVGKYEQDALSIENSPMTKSEIGVSITTDKLRYKNRDKVSLSIENNKSSDNNYEYSLSVIKKGANSLQYREPIDFNKIKSICDTAVFYPDIKSVIISGSVVNIETQKKDSGVLVSLAVLDSKSYFYNVVTNRDGEFFFSFPFVNESVNYYIEANSDNNSYKFEFDEGYCLKPIKLKVLNFELSDSEKKLASEICVNAQITSKFSSDTVHQFNEDSTTISFYGTPDRVFTIDKYINLPNIEEFIYELVLGITVKHDKEGNPYFYQKDKNSLSYSPMLTMVDNIPVYDYNVFLGINIEQVARIEIVDKGYIVGNSRYKGVINIITKRGNYAEVKLPDNSMLFKYNIAKKKVKEFTVEEPNKYHRIPDRRNCLYWNTNLKFEANKEELEFYTSDIKGEYSIILQTVSKETMSVSYTEKSFVVE